MSKTNHMSQMAPQYCYIDAVLPVLPLMLAMYAGSGTAECSFSISAA